MTTNHTNTIAMVDPGHGIGYWLGCPGGAEYGHGLSLTSVHGLGCCERFAALDPAEQARIGWRIPKRGA